MSVNHPQLSVIIATFNAAVDLRRTLDSFSVAERRLDCEIIIQDGGSMDDSCAVAASYVDRLQLSVESGKDTGIYDAWNKALQRISGEWVLFMGAGDTFCHAGALPEVLDILTQLPPNCLYYSVPVVSMFSSDKVLEIIAPARSPLRELPQGMCIPHQGLFHRRELFRTQQFDARFQVAGDYDFICRTLTTDNIRMGKEPCVRMLFGGISSNIQHMRMREKEFWKISRHYFPQALPWKIAARTARWVAYKFLFHIVGNKAAGIFADLPRRLRGKPTLWGRGAISVSLPSLPASPSISLLVATLNRREELRRLLKSLRAQTFRHFRVLIADQNGKGYLDDLLAEFSDLDIVCKEMPSRGVSVARNALLSMAQGELIAFPDDDCWYAPDTLARVVDIFAKNPQCGAVLGIWTSQEDKPLPRYKKGLVSRMGLFRQGETFVQFFRKDAIAGIRFDPVLGPGTGLPYGCGEDTDFLLYTHARTQVYRSPAIRVFHPSPLDTLPNKDKIWSYASGRMFLLRKHKFPIWFQIATVLFPLCMIPVDALRRGRRGLLYRWTMFQARLHAFLRNE